MPPPLPPDPSVSLPQPNSTRPRTGQSKVLIIVACAVFAGLFVLAAIVFLIILPVSTRISDSANRVRCANNLRMIGQSFALYANTDSHQELPRTNFDSHYDSPIRWGSGDRIANPKADPFDRTISHVRDNDVTAALYFAMRSTAALTADNFVCPSSRCKAWDLKLAQVDQYVNWSIVPGSTNYFHTTLSYSIQNPYPSIRARNSGFAWSIRTIGPRADYAIAADINPGPGPKQNVSADALPPQLTKRMMGPSVLRGANSPNHNCEGQNVLYGDGHVDWSATPWCGVGNDNIYTYLKTAPPAGPGSASPAHQGLSKELDQLQSQYDADDTILLPTAE